MRHPVGPERGSATEERERLLEAARASRDLRRLAQDDGAERVRRRRGGEVSERLHRPLGRSLCIEEGEAHLRLDGERRCGLLRERLLVFRPCAGGVCRQAPGEEVEPRLLVGRAHRAPGIREHAARSVRVAGERQRLGVVEREARVRQQLRAGVGDATIRIRGCRGRVGGAHLGRRLELGAAASRAARVREHALDDVPRLAGAVPQAQRRRHT